MAGVRAWRPIRCRPAAVSQSQGMALEGFIGIALMELHVALSAATSGTMTVAIEAAALAGALLLPSALGGGPLYLLVSEWRNEHGFALHMLYA